MTKRKHKTSVTTVLVTGNDGPPLSIESILSSNVGEMETIRATLAQQQLDLLDRRGYLAGAIKHIDEHLDIINNTLRMIEANQR